MTPAPFRWALRGSIAKVRYISPTPMGAATGDVARIYASAEREFGLLAPPIALHSPDPELLAAAWVLLRETLLVGGSTTRAEREAVAAGVSLANQCPYCVEVHGAVLGGLLGDRAGRADARALSADRFDEIGDSRLRALASWARSGGQDPSPLNADTVAELLGVYFAFQYLNRMVSVFLGDSPLPPALPAAAVGSAVTMLGKVLAPTADRHVEAGADLDLLPAAEPGVDLAWVATAPDRAAALGRAAAAVERAGSRVLGRKARAAVAASVVAHGARPPSLGLDWLTAALGPVPAPERPAARLALLTALTPIRVDETVTAAFRAEQAAPAALLAVVSWAAFTAATRATLIAARRAGVAGPAIAA